MYVKEETEEVREERGEEMERRGRDAGEKRCWEGKRCWREQMLREGQGCGEGKTIPQNIFRFHRPQFFFLLALCCFPKSPHHAPLSPPHIFCCHGVRVRSREYLFFLFCFRSYPDGHVKCHVFLWGGQVKSYSGCCRGVPSVVFRRSYEVLCLILLSYAESRLCYLCFWLFVFVFVIFYFVTNDFFFVFFLHYKFCNYFIFLSFFVILNFVITLFFLCFCFLSF